MFSKRFVPDVVYVSGFLNQCLMTWLSKFSMQVVGLPLLGIFSPGRSSLFSHLRRRNVFRKSRRSPKTFRASGHPIFVRDDHEATSSISVMYQWALLSLLIPVTPLRIQAVRWGILSAHH